MADEFQIYPYRRLNQEDFEVKISWQEKDRQEGPKFDFRSLLHRLNLESFFFLGVGLILSNSHILGGIFPFSLAFFAAVLTYYRQYGGIMLVTLLLGQAFINQGASAIINGLILVLFSLWQWFFPTNFLKRWVVLPITVFFLSVPLKLVWAFFNSGVIYQYIAIIVEGLLSAGMVIVYLTFLNVLQARKIPHGLNNEELVCAVLFCLSLCGGLLDITYQGISVGQVVSCYIILMAALISGGGAGAALGSVLGILPSLVEIKAPTLVGIYGFSGMLAGAMHHWHKWGVSVGFLLGNLMLSVYLLEPHAVTTAFLEGFLAILLLLFSPNRLILRLRSVPVLKKDKPVKAGSQGELLGLRINEMAQAFAQLAATLKDYGVSKEQKEEEKYQGLFNTVARVVCEDCSLFKICWEDDFHNTCKNILQAFAQGDLRENLTPENLPQNLDRRCVRGREMATTLNCLYEVYRVNRHWRKKISQYQELLALQMDGLSHALMAATQLNQEGYFHRDLEAGILDHLDKAGFNLEKVQVWQNADGSELEINLRLLPCSQEPTCRQTCQQPLVSLISGLLGVPLMPERISPQELKAGVCEVKLVPVPALAVETGVAQEAACQQEICGDTFATFNLTGGKVALVLSDGMGVGEKAAQESKRAVALLEKLLSVGFKPLQAVKMLNSILLFRGEEESFTTIDLAVIHRQTGETEFIKIGSAPSYIIRQGKFLSITNNTPPAGIISNLPLESTTKVLKPGDILVMLTDGVLERESNALNQEEWLEGIFRYSLQGTPEQMAQQILELVKTGDKKSDDLSVVVARIAWED